MPNCDVCGKDINWKDGYLLSTSHVGTSEAYWEYIIKKKKILDTDPEGSNLVMLAQNVSNQSTGVISTFISPAYQRIISSQKWVKIMLSDGLNNPWNA